MSDKPDWKALAEAAWNAPGWAKAAKQYHRDRPKSTANAGRDWLLADEVLLDRAWHEINEARPTPRTTIEAVMYCVRARGIAALNEPVERLERCDAAATDEINRRIAALKEIP